MLRIPRVLLCRPLGGFTDMLGVCNMCLEYAIKYRRTLIIDTTHSGMQDSFSNYFVINHSYAKNIKLSFTPELKKTLSTLRSNQPCIKKYNGVNNLDFQYTYVKKSDNFHDIATGERLWFNLKDNHSSDLLLYQQWGGHIEDALPILPYINIKEEIRQIINHKIKHILANDYEATHIRNTDYKTDYKSFLNSLAHKIKSKRLLLCSDSMEVMEYAKSYFVNTPLQLLTTDSRTSTSYMPLHGTHGMIGTLDKNDQYVLNIELLTDLFALSHASIIHPAPIYEMNYKYVHNDEKITQPTALLFQENENPLYSTFVRLALYLQQNKEVRKLFFAG
ncbi:MAG: hypothetical protein QM538_05455 [Methylacidiphilales bacterium]|nr:hypothetical protein [Candidatus Methylacidiphilales bacterium]